MIRHRAAIILLTVLLPSLPAVELPAAGTDPLVALPVVPAALPAAASAPIGDVLVPGVRRLRGVAVLLDGAINMDQGPVDGLEVLLCLRDGKTHEALVRLDTTLGAVVKAACLDAFGLPDGQPAEEAGGFPARGTPLRIELRWQDAAGSWLGIDASCLVRDRLTDRPYPPLPYVYTGSRFLALPGGGVDGAGIRQQFMLDSTKSVAVNFDEPDALLASPFPGAAADARFETASAICPPAGTRVVAVLSPCILPVTLEAAADGTLRLGSGAPPLDDRALAELLVRHYGPDRQPPLRAMGIRIPPSAPRSLDGDLRARLLAVAAHHAAWVVPVFTPH